MKRAVLTIAAGLGAALACGPSGPTGNGTDGGADAVADGAIEAGPPNPNGGNLPTGYPNLDLPAVGATSLRILSPTVLDLGKVTTKAADPAPLTEWDFASALPAASNFVVHVGSTTVPVAQVGFKRRPLYAPMSHYELRIQNDLYLVLASPVQDGATVTVDDASATIWSQPSPFVAVADPARFSPAIHVDQSGYEASLSKHAFVGHYLGSLGELDVAAQSFSLVDMTTGKAVFSGPLKPRVDQGFAFSPPQYQRVFDADFSAFQTAGEYQLQVPGFGASYPFFITGGVAMAFARTYAQGMYNQRCGMAKTLPFTRFPDGADHVAPAYVPTGDVAYAPAAALLASNAQVSTGQTAPELTSFTNGLYPYVASGTIDASGGHHDAGDYSKYLMDSGFLIHTLVFAADDFPGVADLDNLGIPESGDGKSDVLQEAKWEADFAAKMQDQDGLFYYLVYPKARAYENDVLPSQGDPQIVWPKNTYASAAATAALAEIASSPRFKQQFPADAARYLQIAKNGWAALQKAVSTYGREGSYQFIYQDDAYLHDDMMAWAAAALFVATGDASYQAALEQWYPDPADASTYHWGWWSMWRGFGNAARTYAFAARSGRLQASQLDAAYLAKCEAEIAKAGDDDVKWAADSAYGTSLPGPTKAYGQAGWYFSGTQAFDLAVANALAPKPEYTDAILTNLGYEGGANPVNVSYLSGLGWQRPREMVSQFFQNDRHRLPPTGIDYGNVVTGYMYLDLYKGELDALTFPSDGAQSGAYAFYDRYAHQFNTATEADTVNEGWGFAAIVGVAAQTDAAKAPWTARGAAIATPASASASKPVTVTLSSPDGVDLGPARVTWEAAYQEPFVGGTSFTFTPAQTGPTWIDAEAMMPDGRRLVAATQITVQ
ncbi:MAG TPA: glycoside hydrolase family 9 protein [Polyangiaceae bacterium]|nr:glycoside hydrolase family 9 protein [Polyangiaceae bacterium]